MSRGFVFDRLVLLIISMLLPIVLTPLAGVTGRGAVRTLRGDGENPYIKVGGVSGRDSGSR